MAVIAAFAAAGIVAALATIYFVWKSREFVKFLAGAFFVSGGIQLYLALAGVSIPLIGTELVQTPDVGYLRCVPHFIFFLLAVYFGFIRKPRSPGHEPTA